MYKPANCRSVSGEFAWRALKNFTRLTDPEYRPATLEIEDGRDWPGDRRGRALLALTLHKRLTGLVSPFYADTLEDTLRRVEEKGYMGARMENGVADEQQLSGHNWLLRALLEIYRDTESPRVKAAADRLVQTLHLPCTPLYRDYPHDPALRYLDGKPSGVLIEEAVNGWKLSTDIGCAFMSLDGLTQYAEIIGGAAVEALLEEMIEAFFRLDPVGSSLQTHATLTAARSLMRRWETTGEARLLEKAREIWALYVENGMTENYANFNWFKRPLWTEPCAIVDSYMLTTALYRATEEQAYLEAANRILYSALYASQRPNGGFGCDVCVQGEVRTLAVRASTYEASWCCTMRGAEGLYEAARNAVLCAENRVLLTNLVPGEFHAGPLKLRVGTEYPAKGEAVIQVQGAEGATRIGVYVPESVDLAGVRVARDGAPVGTSFEGRICWIETGAPDTLTVSFPLEVKRQPARLSRGATYWRGPELLGVEEDPESAPTDPVWSGERVYTYKGLRLFPAANGVLRDKEKLEKRRLRVVFADEDA